MAGKPIYHQDFYAGPRPWTTGLLYKILGADLEIASSVGDDQIVRSQPNAQAVVIAQTAIYALGWITLAYLAASMINTLWLRPITSGIILTIALSPAIHSWNRVLLSESLSISLMALLLGLWLWMARGWQWHKFFLLLFVTVFWVFARETNALIVLGVGILLFLFSLIKKKHRLYLIIAVFYILLYTVSANLSDIRNRWVTPLANVVFQRILTDQEAFSYFQSQGMPVDRHVLAMQGKLACSDDCAFFKQEKYSLFRDWLFINGRRVYIDYLFAYFPQSMAAPIRHLDELTINSPNYSKSYLDN